jgi:hypothetical protein
MKITYEIDTQDPSQAMERRQLEKANDMAMVLWEMTFNVRKHVNNRVENAVADGYRVSAEDAISWVFQEYNRLMEEHGIRVEELNN